MDAPVIVYKNSKVKNYLEDKQNLVSIAIFTNQNKPKLWKQFI